MAKAWEVVVLDNDELTTIRLPQYNLTIVNLRCYPGEDDTAIVVLDKMTGEIGFTKARMCDYALS